MNRNAIRARGLVQIIESREFGNLVELIERLRLMPGLVAHDILDRADAMLDGPDRQFLETVLECITCKSQSKREAYCCSWRDRSINTPRTDGPHFAKHQTQKSRPLNGRSNSKSFVRSARCGLLPKIRTILN